MEIMNRTNNICALNEVGGILLCISFLEKLEFLKGAGRARWVHFKNSLLHEWFREHQLMPLMPFIFTEWAHPTPKGHIIQTGLANHI